mmetsp:Transcript_2807/g.8243  ORF Transcript_2807/g.8243 Transcript_2807/m.8243 type:complete len:312 (+) Transcript_2807:3036-3971(+)
MISGKQTQSAMSHVGLCVRIVGAWCMRRRAISFPLAWLEGGTVAPEGQLQLLGLSLAITTAHRFFRSLLRAAKLDLQLQATALATPTTDAAPVARGPGAAFRGKPPTAGAILLWGSARPLRGPPAAEGVLDRRFSPAAAGRRRGVGCVPVPIWHWGRSPGSCGVSAGAGRGGALGGLQGCQLCVLLLGRLLQQRAAPVRVDGSGIRECIRPSRGSGGVDVVQPHGALAGGAPQGAAGGMPPLATLPIQPIRRPLLGLLGVRDVQFRQGGHLRHVASPPRSTCPCPCLPPLLDAGITATVVRHRCAIVVLLF